MNRNMDEKKGLLTALAETLKQYEMIQTDDKESQAIALEEKLDEIAKMISSLSDRVDSLSSRLTSIGDKVDAMAAASEKEPEGGLFDAITSEPVFDSAEADDSFHVTESEEVYEEPVEDDDIDERIEAEMKAEEEARDVDQTEDEEPEEPQEEAEEEPDEAEEESGEEEVMEEEEVDSPEEETEEEEAEQESEEPQAEQPEPEAAPGEKAGRDWYDWEYDYPQESVDNLLDSMGINDKLEFVRELFNSDPMMFDSQMKEVETMPNFKAIVQFFRQAHPEWDQSSDTVYRFYMHIRRKFRN